MIYKYITIDNVYLSHISINRIFRLYMCITIAVFVKAYKKIITLLCDEHDECPFISDI